MQAHAPFWIFLAAITITCLQAKPSIGDRHRNQMSSTDAEHLGDYYTSSSRSDYLPQILRMMKKFRIKNENPPEKIRRVPLLGGPKKKKDQDRALEKRKFPEIDSKGFDEDIFDEGFGDWSPMKRW